MPAISSFLIAASIGMSAYSAQKQMQANDANVQANRQAIAAQQRAEDARKQQMELDAQRRSKEIVRQQQRARSAGLTNATAQGAQFGSGLPGGYGQIGGQTGVNLLGTQQNLGLGRDIFAANADLSQARMQMASAQGDMFAAQGLGSLGQAMIKNLGPMSNIFANYFPKQGFSEGVSANG